MHVLVDDRPRADFKFGNFALDADELGPQVAALLFEPVRVHEPRQVGVAVGVDGVQEGGFVVGHAHSARLMRHFR